MATQGALLAACAGGTLPSGGASAEGRLRVPTLPQGPAAAAPATGPQVGAVAGPSDAPAPPAGTVAAPSDAVATGSEAPAPEGPPQDLAAPAWSEAQVGDLVGASQAPGHVVVASEGAILAAEGGGAWLVVPAGALDRDATLRWARADAADAGDLLPGDRIALDLGGAQVRPGQALLLRVALSDAEAQALAKAWGDPRTAADLGLVKEGALWYQDTLIEGEAASPYRLSQYMGTGPEEVGVLENAARVQFARLPPVGSPVSHGGRTGRVVAPGEVQWQITRRWRQGNGQRGAVYGDCYLPAEVLPRLSADFSPCVRTIFGPRGQITDFRAVASPGKAPATGPSAGGGPLPGPALPGGLGPLPKAAPVPLPAPPWVWVEAKAEVRYTSTDPKLAGQPAAGLSVRFEPSPLANQQGQAVDTNAQGLASFRCVVGTQLKARARLALGPVDSATAEAKVGQPPPVLRLSVRKDSPRISLRLASPEANLNGAIALRYRVDGGPEQRANFQAAATRQFQQDFDVHVNDDNPHELKVVGLDLPAPLVADPRSLASGGAVRIQRNQRGQLSLSALLNAVK